MNTVCVAFRSAFPYSYLGRTKVKGAKNYKFSLLPTADSITNSRPNSGSLTLNTEDVTE